MRIALATRFKIIGVEVISLGAFLLFELAHGLRQPGSGSLSQGISWDYGLVAVLLIAVGFELLSLIKDLPRHDSVKSTPPSTRDPR
jgi:hypothetical protein